MNDTLTLLRDVEAALLAIQRYDPTPNYQGAMAARELPSIQELVRRAGELAPVASVDEFIADLDKYESECIKYGATDHGNTDALQAARKKALSHLPQTPKKD